MSFINYLRDRNAKELKHPVSFGFSAAQWEEYYRKLSDGSWEDKNIRDFGVFLHQRLEKVRDSLKQIELQSPFISDEEVVLRLVRHLNEGYLRLQTEGIEAIQDRTHISIEEMGHGRTIKSSTGTKYTPQEALEGMTDCARHVLRSAMQKKKGYGTAQPMEPVWEAEQSLLTAVHLAQFYDSFENQWQSALWTDAKFQYNGHHQPYHLSELHALLSMDSAIDLARRAGKYHRDTEEVRSIKMSSDTMDERIFHKNENGEIVVKRLRELPDPLQHLTLSLAYQRFSLTEVSSAALMNEAHGVVKGLTVRKVSDGWLQLSFLALQSMLESQAYSQGSSEYKNSLTAPISQRSLSTALASALQITEAQAKDVIDYHTFDGSHKEHTLWERPLLKHPHGLLFVWLPLVAFHPMRLISNWAKEVKHLKVAHGKRGRPFETEVVTGLLGAAAMGSLREKPFVLGPGIQIADQRIGDIDALLILGDTAFVLECRNLMHPATAHEFWGVADELGDKAEQAIRKRDYLRDNPSILTGMIEKSPFSGLKRKINKVVAVVLSNSYLFEGVNDVEPYFVHVDTLFNTILTSGPMFGDIGPDGQEVTLHVDCFKPGTAPGDALIRAIAKPAKAEFYRQCLTKMDFPIPAIDQTEPFGIYSQWAFVPPEVGSLRSILNNCSFASDIVIK